MRVTMDVFSGRPNPSWRLTRHDAQEMIARSEVSSLNPARWQSPRLGLRGFVLERELGDPLHPRGMPSRFAVGDVALGGQPIAPAAMSAPLLLETQPERNALSDDDNARWLLDRARGKISDNLLDAVQTTLEAQPVTEPAAPVEAGDAPIALKAFARAAPCQPFLTLMRLDIWNLYTVQPYNNCYNYATNCITNTLAQPGRRAGQIYTAIDCAEVSRAAEADGCLPICHNLERTIALAIWPGVDFHWWRLHAGDFWAQKLGWSLATNRDNSGRIIGNGLTPENCNRFPYTVFCGYFHAPLALQVI